MGLFGKSKKEERRTPEIPQLPPLPRLPDFQGISDYDEDPITPIHQLPAFPSNALGAKFSQNTIKEAISGGEDDSMGADSEDMDEDDMRMTREPLRRPMTMSEDSTRWSANSERKIGMEPVFVRIDKFEDALRIFNEARRKISQIERTLEDIKQVREKEEKELQSWQTEIKSMKDQIEKIDRDIFSKI